MSNYKDDAWKIADYLRSRASLAQDLTIQVASEAADKVGVRLTRDVWDRLSQKRGVDRLIPSVVADLLVALVTADGPQRIINLWCGEGLIAARLADAHPDAVVTAIDPSEEALAVAHYFDRRGSINWVLGRPGDLAPEYEGLPDRFDALVSTAPFGLQSRRQASSDADGTRQINDEEGRVDLLRFADALSDEGEAILLTTQSILQGVKSKRLLDALRSRGLHLTAAISLPAGTFSPMTSIGSVVAVFGRSEHDDVFMAEIPQTTQAQAQLVENMRARRVGKSPETGALVPVGELAPIEALIARRDHARDLAAAGITPRKLADLLLEVRRPIPSGDTFVFEACDNCAFMPLVGFGPARTELPEKLSREWVQLVFDPEQAVAEYVATWLSSPFGRKSREAIATGTSIPRVGPAAIEGLQVPLPPVEQQDAALSLDARLAALSSEAHQLREDLWARPRRLDEIARRVDKMSPDQDVSEWIESLPLPLSTVGRAYYARQDARERIDALFNFFEAMAEFHATILLSGVAADERFLEDSREALLGTPDERRRYYGTTSLGGWTTMASRLSKEIRTRLSSKSDDERDAVLQWFGRPDDTWLEMITDKALARTLSEANRLRNDWKGHGGASGDSVNVNRLAELEKLLASVRTVVSDRWDTAKLVAPCTMRQSAGSIHATVDVLVGTGIPFLQETFVVKDNLDDAFLYVVHGAGPSAMRLLPLVRMMPAPETASTTCYFYNRIQGDEVRYVSYYYEQGPETQVSASEGVSAVVLAALGLEA